jgi:hypothetical protein
LIDDKIQFSEKDLMLDLERRIKNSNELFNGDNKGGNMFGKIKKCFG